MPLVQTDDAEPEPGVEEQAESPPHVIVFSTVMLAGRPIRRRIVLNGEFPPSECSARSI